MTLADCRRCHTRPEFIGVGNLWAKGSTGRWQSWQYNHPEVCCPQCGNHECGCTLNDLWPDKNHYRYATARQVIGQWNQRNQAKREENGNAGELKAPR